MSPFLNSATKIVFLMQKTKFVGDFYRYYALMVYLLKKKKNAKYQGIA